MPKPVPKNTPVTQKQSKITQSKNQVSNSRVSLNETLSNIQTIVLKCSGNLPAKQFCLSQKCQSKKRFTCFNQQCVCQADHQNCKKSSILSAIKKIRNKINDPSLLLKDQISKTFDLIIQKIASIKEKLLLKVDQYKDKLKENELSQLEKKFLKIVQKNQENQIFSATQSKQLWNNIHTENKQNYNYINHLKEQLQNYQSKTKDSFDSLVQFFDATFKGIQKHLALPASSTQQIKPTLASPRGPLFTQSTLIKSFIDTKKITKFFPQDKKIKSTNLIFRASKHNFSLKQYFDTCGNVSNQLILCETSSGKLIGGYSPISHEFTGKGRKDFLGNEPVPDQTKTSFVFSLTKADKLQLVKPSFAVYRYKSKSFIQFGQGQLKICDNANNIKDSTTQINNGSYHSSNYKAGLKDSYLRFNGNETSQFTLWQMQVWKIQFDEPLKGIQKK